MPEKEYRTLLASAHNLLDQGHAADACTLYRQICASGSASAEDHYQLANILHASGDLAGALHSLEKAVARDPGHAQAWNMMGAINGMAGQHQAAANNFHKALALQPHATETRLNLAHASLQLRQWEAAAEQCAETLRENPDSAEAWSMLGRSFTERGQHTEACDAFRQALRLRPELAQAHFRLGNSLLTAGNQREAVTCMRTAIRLKPDFFRAYITLAATLMTLGEPDEAARLCEQALALEPGNIEAMSLATTIDQNLGNIDKAQTNAPPVFVFHHIPKCGGTSILAALSNWFTIVADYGSGWTGYYPDKKNIALLGPSHCLCGHFEVEGNYLHQRYPEVFISDKYRVITFVRDPLQVKMSLYRYEIKNNVSNAKSLEDHLFTRPNYMAERFCATQSDYMEIIDKYDFIGILEEGQASLDLLARITGKTRLELPWENRTAENAKSATAELSDDCINRFRQENELDYLIYEYCTEKFRKMRTEFGLT